MLSNGLGGGELGKLKIGKFSGGGKGVVTDSLTGENELDVGKKELDCVNAVLDGGKGEDVSKEVLLVG